MRIFKENRNNVETYNLNKKNMVVILGKIMRKKDWRI